MKFCITEAYFNLHSIHIQREKYNPTFYALYTEREKERERERERERAEDKYQGIGGETEL